MKTNVNVSFDSTEHYQDNMAARKRKAAKEEEEAMYAKPSNGKKSTNDLGMSDAAYAQWEMFQDNRSRMFEQQEREDMDYLFADPEATVKPTLNNMNVAQIEMDNKETVVKNTNVRRDILKKKYAGVLETNEGLKTGLYKPTKGSGWTIANGVDFFGTSRADAVKSGIPERFILAADKAKAWGKTNVPVTKGIAPMTRNEAVTVMNNFAEKDMDYLMDVAKKNPGLSPKGVAYVGQAKHWAGSIRPGGNNITKLQRKVGGKYVSDVQNLLDSGKATDATLAAAFESTRKTYPEVISGVQASSMKGKGDGLSWRSNTLLRYAANLLG